MKFDDISPDFRWNREDERVVKKLLPFEGTPEAIQQFAREAYKLTNHCYWFLLSTLWVSYTGGSDLALWKRLLSSDRPLRETSIMKPSESNAYRTLPEKVLIYRAHRKDEADWISYTLLPEKAATFAVQSKVDEVKQYSVSRSDILCLFLRREEAEILVLDKTRVEYVQTIGILLQDQQSPDAPSIIALSIDGSHQSAAHLIISVADTPLVVLK